MREGWTGRVTYRIPGEKGDRHVNFNEKGRGEDENLLLLKQWKEGGDFSILTLSLRPRRKLLLQSAFAERWIPGEQVERVFMNGFQTWTESREFRRFERMGGLKPLFSPWIKKYSLRHYGDYTFSNYHTDRLHGFSWMYFSNPEELLFLGSLSDRLGYTRFEWFREKSILRVERECEGLDVEETIPVLRVMIKRGEEQDIFDTWFRVRNQGRISPLSQMRPIGGWTSWYRYYAGITAEIVRRNLASFRERKIPIEVFQIDDGWERAIGDWLEPGADFEGKMKSLASEIRAAGYRPGLWVAPFLVEEYSHIFHEHPNWCVQTAEGRPMLSGYNPFQWKGNFYALDIYLDEVRNYLREVFDRIIRDWGFSFLKLDFLYAAALVPTGGKSRGMIMDDAMRLLTELTGDATLLGCGVPLEHAFGKVKYCRIGADVALKWEDRKLKMLGYRERVSTINSLVSTIGRRQLNGRAFFNDPDVFILRSLDQKMNPEQRNSLFLINQIFGGLLFTSDDPSDYSTREMDLYLSQFPLRKKEVLVASEEGAEFTIGDLEYIALFNLGRHPVVRKLPEGLYYSSVGPESLREGGSRKGALQAGGSQKGGTEGRSRKNGSRASSINEGGFREGGRVELPPFASRCYLRVSEEPFSIAGSSGILFPGSEIEEKSLNGGDLEFSIHPQTRNNGYLYIRVPPVVEGCRVNGRYVEAEEKVGLHLLVVSR